MKPGRGLRWTQGTHGRLKTRQSDEGLTQWAPPRQSRGGAHWVNGVVIG